MLSSHMRFGSCCALALVVVISFAAQGAMRAPQLTAPIDLHDGSLSPKLEYGEMTMAGVPVRDGFVIAWGGTNGVLHIAHLDSGGAVTPSVSMAVTFPNQNQYSDRTLRVVGASDGKIGR